MNPLKKQEAEARQTGIISANIRLQGRVLLSARALWLVLASFELLGFLINLLQPLFGNQTLICPFALTCPYDTNTPTLHALQQAQIPLGDYAIYVTAFGLLSALTFVGLSTLLFWQVFDQVAGLFASFGFLLVGSIGLMGDLSKIPLALGLAGAVQIQCLFLCFGFFLVTFPDGRFVPRWSWLIGCTLFVQGLLFQFNLISFWPFPLILIEVVFAYGSPVALQIYRYRRLYTPVQRQQTKWVVFGMVSAMGLLLLAVFVQGFIPVTGRWGALLFLACDSIAPAAFLLIPVSLTMAMLRSRLWEIDVLINRTLVYGLLTLTLLMVYLVLVFAGQALLSSLLGRESGVVLVGSTLVVAALFQPLRHRIQQFIDRRFYRRKYDVQKTLDAFSSTLREAVDLEQVREQLLAVVQETMQPASLSLWLCTGKQQVVAETRREAL